MAIQELDELFKTFTSPEDRQQLEQILGRNEAALEYLKSGSELYSAFIDGDRAAIARLEEKNKPTIRNSMTITPTPVPSATSPSPASPAVSTPAFDMTQLEKMFDQKLTTLQQQLLDSETFTNKVTGLVKKTADELAPGMYSTASRTANEIYDIKFAHNKEFGQPLDMAKFNEFLETNKGKFSTLTDSHNAFVNEERIQNRIKQGVAEEREKERAARDVPGNTLGKSSTPSMADRFVAVNKTKFDTQRGEGLDQAAAALRRLAMARTE